jgi:tetratricopeptide (TPR) repeat protein
MSHLKTRTTSLMLVFGIFFTLSCATVNQHNGHSDDLSGEAEIEQRLSEIDSQLRDNPDNSSLNIEKAELLVTLAQVTDPPASRLPIYNNVRDINSAGVIEQSDRTAFEEVIKKAWTHEQSEAVKRLQRDEISASESEHEQAIDHLHNAITVNPDSLSTYNLLANAYYRKGNFRSAIETLDRANQAAGADEIDLKEKIAYLQLESGDIESSINTYQLLAEARPESANIRHGLANAYMLDNRHEEAVEILHGLIAQYPNRIEYRESLTGELYFIFRDKVTQLLQQPDSHVITQGEAEPLFESLDQIDDTFERMKQSIPLSDENAYRKAAYLKNSSELLNQLFSRADSNLEEHISERRNEYLERSLILWERLADNNPDNINYIRNLHQTYLDLGMEEEAESLERSYNL